MKIPFLSCVLLTLPLPLSVTAIFPDEVDHIDYHHTLLGLPQRETTFFHRPRKADKASLLYTLSDVGLLGAVNPSNGDVVWRQLIAPTAAARRVGHLRAGEGESWVCSAYGNTVQAWDAVGGRAIWSNGFPGEIRDLEIMELTETPSKDVLVLFEEEGSTVLRRLFGGDGRVVWEFTGTTNDIPLQVSTDAAKIFIVSLHGASGSYNLQVAVVDPATGKRLDDIIVGAKGGIENEKDVMFVGANSAAPIVAWTDTSLTKLKVNVLGTKNTQEFDLAPDTASVEIHAPHLIQSQPHFLVHSHTKTGNKADVYHVDLKTNIIKHAYELPHLPGNGAFSTSSVGTNVYFTRVTDSMVILLGSQSSSILGQWDLKTDIAGSIDAIHAASEVVKKSEESYAVRTAALTTTDDWILVRNGEQAWSRPEGMTGSVAAVFAEIPESETLAKNLELEAHSNPLNAFIHRAKRHYEDLQYLPGYLQHIPERLLGGVLGTAISTSNGLSRDSFGLHKLVVLATSRGKLYCLDTGDHGKIVWSLRAYDIPDEEQWDVKGMFVDDHKGQVSVRGSRGEQIVLELATGNILEASKPGSQPPVQSTAIVNSPSGPWLLPVGRGGEVGDVPFDWRPKERIVVRGTKGGVQGLLFPTQSTSLKEVVTWTFVPRSGEVIAHIATRPAHDPVASIGRVLGDRQVNYKYLNPNTMVISTIDEHHSTLTTYLIDTISGQILTSSTYSGVDVKKPVECTISENWFVCSFFGQYILRDNQAQSIKGYQLAVTDLYDADIPNYRGPLGDIANFSSLDPVDSPLGPALPSTVTQTFVLGAPMSALTVTQTRQGITSRQLLGYISNTHGIIGIPRQVLEPRRPVGRDPSAIEREEGLTRYVPGIEIDPRLVITHERDVVGVKQVIVSPTSLESTSLVFAYGIDVFGTQVTPSFSFDVLGKGFNKVTLVATVVALFVGVLILGPVVRRKQINMIWRS